MAVRETLTAKSASFLKALRERAKRTSGTAVRLALLLLGGLLPMLALQFIELTPRYMRTVRAKEELRVYDLFNPRYAAQDKHVLLSSCFTINNIASNVLDKPGKVERHGAAFLGQMMNFLLRQEYGSPSIGFYDMGRGATGNTDHMFYLAHLLEAPRVKSIIFSNEPNGLYNFPGKRPETQLEAIIVLERWREEYPELREHIDAYLDSLHRSRGYFKAIGQWLLRNHMRKDAESFRKRPPPYNQPFAYDGWRAEQDPGIYPAGYLGGAMRWRSAMDCARLMAGIRDLLITSFSALKDEEVETRVWDADTLKYLDIVTRNYLDPSLDQPFLMKTADWETTLDGELPEKKQGIFNHKDTITWLHILGGICKARKIQLVVYLPPDMSITEEVYASKYKPRFVDKLMEVLGPYHPILIDHTIEHNLTQCDIYWEGFPYKKGHHTNMVGTLKKARLLMKELAAQGVLTLDRDPDKTAWAGEAALPPVKRSIRAYSSDHADPGDEP